MIKKKAVVDNDRLRLGIKNTEKENIPFIYTSLPKCLSLFFDSR